MITMLRSWRAEGVTLESALSSFAGRALTGLCYGPGFCAWVLWNGDQAQCPEEGFDLGQVFEARFFDAGGELRWLRDPAGEGTGSAVYLSEGTTAPAEDWMPQTALEDCEVQPGRYLLWGQGCDTQESLQGWSHVSAASIGTRATPVSGLTAGGNVYLDYREYIGRDCGPAGEDGNAAVLEQRFLRLGLDQESCS